MANDGVINYSYLFSFFYTTISSNPERVIYGNLLYKFKNPENSARITAFTHYARHNTPQSRKLEAS